MDSKHSTDPHTRFFDQQFAALMRRLRRANGLRYAALTEAEPGIAAALHEMASQEVRAMKNDEQNHYLARADAESGIQRCDKLIQEAQCNNSPLAPYLGRYIAQRAAYALTAAVTHARIERLERSYDN